MISTAFALDVGYAGMLWCGHYHRVRDRARKCARRMSQFSPSILMAAGQPVEAFREGTTIPVTTWQEWDTNRGPEGRCQPIPDPSSSFKETS